MADYRLSAEGSYTLSDLKEKLEAITDWEWDEKAGDTAEYRDGEVKFHDALNTYEALKVALISPNPRLVDKNSLLQVANLWDKYATSKYKVPRQGII